MDEVVVGMFGFETPCHRSTLVEGGDCLGFWLVGCVIGPSHLYLDSFGVDVRITILTRRW